MKTGQTLTALAQELERQQESKVDVIADTREARVTPTRNASQPFNLYIEGQDQKPVTKHASRQLTQWAGIPAAYVDRMLDKAPELAATNVNYWMRETPSRRMFRGLDGVYRAVMSDRYQRIDNYDTLTAILPTLQELSDIGMEIHYSQLTESHMHLKAVFPKVAGEVKVGDVVQSGIYFRNSEIGQGSFVVAPMLYRLVCLNGMISQDGSIRERHVGKRIESDGVIEYSDEALAADDKARLLKVRDTVRSIASQSSFEALLDKFREAQNGPKMQAPIKAVELLSSTVDLRAGESDALMRHLIEGGDLSRFGALNAVTRLAQDVESHDRSQELEAVGGKILELPASSWRRIAEAA